MPKKILGCIEGENETMNICDSKTYQEDLSNLLDYIIKQDREINVLVTGASGLIGSMLVDTLMTYSTQNDHYKICVYCLGRSVHRLEKRFSNWMTYENIYFLEGDICVFNLDNILFDFIIHAASNADPRTYATQPISTIITNIKGTENVLNYCQNHRSTRLLLTSTFEVYGSIDGQDIYTEDAYGTIDCTRLRAGYPESKRIAELLARSYHEEYGIDVIIARICSVYGPTMLQNDSKAHAQFINDGLNHQDIVLKSEGKQKRTYCYVTDIVAALLHLMFNGISGEIYNVANSNSIATIAEVAKMVASICGQKVVFNIPDLIEAKGFSEPQNCVLDTHKIESLGWMGKYSLEDGLRRTIQILKEVR